MQVRLGSANPWVAAHRVASAMFTISYSCAVVAPVLSGLLWDISGIAWSAFVPLGLCACILMVLAPTIRLPAKT